MKEIPRDKKLFLVCHNENCDHAFYYSDEVGGYYDKGGTWERRAALHLSTGGALVILVSQKHYSASDEIIDVELPKICSGEDPSTFEMVVHRVFNNLQEWGEY